MWYSLFPSSGHSWASTASNMAPTEFLLMLAPCSSSTVAMSLGNLAKPASWRSRSAMEIPCLPLPVNSGQYWTSLSVYLMVGFWSISIAKAMAVTLFPLEKMLVRVLSV